MKYTFTVAVTLWSALAALEGSGSPAISSLKKLNVAAVDADGQPVTDLRASDFQVFEDGKPKNIAFFRFTGGKAIPAALEPGEYSNRTGVPAQATVILVDLLSDRLLSGGVIGKEIGDALKKLESGNDVYLYFLTAHGEVFPVHGLPEAGSEETPSAEPWTRNAGPVLDLAVKKLVTLKPVDDHDLDIRFKQTSAALESLGGQIWQVPGRKNLVWVTHGVQLIGYSMSGVLMDFTQPVRRMAEKFEEGQIAIYTVQQSTHGAAEDLVTYGGQTLDMFANLTGGRVYRTDESGTAIKQAMADSHGNYRIAYESDALNGNGKHHKIKVTCTRKGVRLQTEQEFYSLAVPPSAEDFERAVLEAAAASPLDATEIGLRGSLAREPGANSAHFELRIAPEDLLLRQAQGRSVGKVSVNISTYDAEDKATALPPKTVEIDLAAGDGILVQQDVPMNAAVRKVRAVVVDKELRAAGSITIPIAR
jgi:VWFA-related protein